MFGPPKTEAGRRTVAIPPHVLGDVKAHLDCYGKSAPQSLVSSLRKRRLGHRLLVLPSNANTPCVLPCAAPHGSSRSPDIPAPAGGRW